MLKPGLAGWFRGHKYLLGKPDNHGRREQTLESCLTFVSVPTPTHGYYTYTHKDNKIFLKYIYLCYRDNNIIL